MITSYRPSPLSSKKLHPAINYYELCFVSKLTPNFPKNSIIESDGLPISQYFTRSAYKREHL